MTAAVIVAAGLSSRMGRFKPLLPLGGSTVIGRCVESLKTGGVERIIAVTGKNGSELRDYLAPLGVHCVHNPRFAETDMLVSAKLGLSAVPREAEAVFFLPGDSPLFSPATLGALLSKMRRSGCGVVIPVCGGRSGHPTLIAAAAIPALLSYGGDGGLRGAMAAAELDISRIETGDPGILLDADTPEDYERLLAYTQIKRAD